MIGRKACVPNITFCNTTKDDVLVPVVLVRPAGSVGWVTHRGPGMKTPRKHSPLPSISSRWKGNGATERQQQVRSHLRHDVLGDDGRRDRAVCSCAWKHTVEPKTKRTPPPLTLITFSVCEAVAFERGSGVFSLPGFLFCAFREVRFVLSCRRGVAEKEALSARRC